MSHPTYNPRPQLNFRLLCSAGSAGAFNGVDRQSVKELENETGCEIRVLNPIQNRRNRVINVTGQAALSAAQEGLLRAYERILGLERNPDNGIFKCRLLCPPWQLSVAQPAFENLENLTGATIHVIAKEEEPACAGPDDVMIHITGGVVAVKSALLLVSHLLQSAEVPYPHLQFEEVSQLLQRA